MYRPMVDWAGLSSAWLVGLDQVRLRLVGSPRVGFWVGSWFGFDGSWLSDVVEDERS